jgi:hypothetical protein
MNFRSIFKTLLFVVVSAFFLANCGGSKPGDSAASLASPAPRINATGPAGIPETGWWWNPAEGGRGYAIEVQGDKIFLAGFMYEVDGQATWYVSTLTRGGDGAYVGDLTRYAGGQTLLGAYKAPTGNTKIGTITAAFDATNKGSITVQAAQGPASTKVIQIERFPISKPTAFAPSQAGFKNGWYWNEAEGGRGYFVEVQGDQAFVAAYVYSDSGQPTWHVSTANLVNPTTLSGALQSYNGGQSLFGSYVFPGTAVSPGAVSIQLSNQAIGSITFAAAVSVAVKPYAFGGDDSPGQVPMGPSAYFSFGTGSKNENNDAIALVYAANDTSPIKLSFSTYADVNSLPAFFSSNNFSGKPLDGSTALLPSVRNSFISNGKVYTVDLTTGQTPTVQQLSTLATACRVNDLYEISIDGNDTWIAVTTTEPNDTCGYPNRFGRYMVRTTWHSAVIPLRLPDGVNLLARLPNKDRSLRFILANDVRTLPAKLVLYSAEMVPVGEVSNGASEFVARVIGALDNPDGFMYLRIGNGLRHLTWDEKGATLSAPINFTFKSPEIPFYFNDGYFNEYGVLSGNFLYFMDSSSLYKIRGTSTPELISTDPVGFPKTPFPRDIFVTPTRLLVYTRENEVSASNLISLSRAGGASQSLPAPIRPAYWALFEDSIFVFPRTASGVLAGELRRMNTDGTNDILLQPRVVPIGFERTSSWVRGKLRVDNNFDSYASTARSVYFCLLELYANDCNGGIVMEMSLATGKLTVLGALPVFAGHTGVYPNLYGTANQGVLSFSLGGTTSSGVSQRDLYFAKGGVANSLTRLTDEMK